jgi:hypothetical protein
LDEKKGLSFWDGVTVFALAVAAIAISNWLDLNHKWENALVYTVLLFTIVTLALRHFWNRARFWSYWLLALALHLFIFFPVVRALPPEWRGIPATIFVPAMMIEGVLLLGLLSKTMAANQAGYRP